MGTEESTTTFAVVHCLSGFWLVAVAPGAAVAASPPVGVLSATISPPPLEWPVLILYVVAL